MLSIEEELERQLTEMIREKLDLAVRQAYELGRTHAQPIRCKDCYYCELDPDGRRCFCTHNSGLSFCKPNSYCSWAGRKEDGQEIL